MLSPRYIYDVMPTVSSNAMLLPLKGEASPPPQVALGSTTAITGKPR